MKILTDSEIADIGNFLVNAELMEGQLFDNFIRYAPQTYWKIKQKLIPRIYDAQGNCTEDYYQGSEFNECLFTHTIEFDPLFAWIEQFDDDDEIEP